MPKRQRVPVRLVVDNEGSSSSGVSKTPTSSAQANRRRWYAPGTLPRLSHCSMAFLPDDKPNAAATPSTPPGKRSQISDGSGVLIPRQYGILCCDVKNSFFHARGMNSKPLLTHDEAYPPRPPKKSDMPRISVTKQEYEAGMMRRIHAVLDAINWTPMDLAIVCHPDNKRSDSEVKTLEAGIALRGRRTALPVYHLALVAETLGIDIRYFTGHLGNLEDAVEQGGRFDEERKRLPRRQRRA